MSLSKKQQRFAKCVAELILYADKCGYAVTFGDAYRDPRVHGVFKSPGGYGSPRSVHKLRLAVDLNLFVTGRYISDGYHAAYTTLGEHWESLDPDARWGGRFRDANHFSFEHWGCK